MKTKSLTRAAALALVIVFAVGSAYAGNYGKVYNAQPNIVQTAIAAGSFSTLVTAIKAAGLVDTLSQPGPYTVFAPNDEAFAKLPAGTVENLLKPENKSDLVALLTYHVVPGKLMAQDVTQLSMAKTVNGKDVNIALQSGAVKVDQAQVIKTDIETSNGVIHVIDEVILP